MISKGNVVMMTKWRNIDNKGWWNGDDKGIMINKGNNKIIKNNLYLKIYLF